MASDGDYSFSVNVWNRFAPDSNINIKVIFKHWPYGKKPKGENIDLKSQNSNIYTVPPGDIIGFPLYWNDETLDISLEPIDGKTPVFPPTYYIEAGPKANWISAQLKPETMTFISSGTGQYYDSTNRAGIWGIDSAKTNINQWTLTCNKYIPDPETTNVSIGPDIP